MKKFRVLFILSLLMLSVIAVFAQDSSAIAPDASVAVGNLFNYLVAFLPAKYQPMVITLLTVLFLMEQILASTQKIKANSTFQLISHWIVTIFSSVKKKG